MRGLNPDGVEQYSVVCIRITSGGLRPGSAVGLMI